MEETKLSPKNKLSRFIAKGTLTALVATALSTVLVYADAFETMWTNLKTTLESITDKMELIAPILAGLALIIVIIMYIMTTDERKSESYKRKILATIIVLIVLGALPILTKAAVAIGNRIAGIS